VDSRTAIDSSRKEGFQLDKKRVSNSAFVGVVTNKPATHCNALPNQTRQHHPHKSELKSISNPRVVSPASIFPVWVVMDIIELLHEHIIAPQVDT